MASPANQPHLAGPTPYGDLRPVAPAPSADVLTAAQAASLASDAGPSRSDFTGPGTPAAPAAGDPHTGLRHGDWDITLAGAGSNNDNWTAGAAAVALSAGYMLNDSLELSVRQMVSMDNPQGSETFWNGATRAALDLHIPLETVYPFVGGNFGRVYGGSVVDTFTCAPEAGVKWFLKPDAYLLAMAEYQMLFDHVSEIDDAWHDGVFVYMLGFGLRF